MTEGERENGDGKRELYKIPSFFANRSTWAPTKNKYCEESEQKNTIKEDSAMKKSIEKLAYFWNSHIPKCPEHITLARLLSSSTFQVIIITIFLGYEWLYWSSTTYLRPFSHAILTMT